MVFVRFTIPSNPIQSTREDAGPTAPEDNKGKVVRGIGSPGMRLLMGRNHFRIIKETQIGHLSRRLDRVKSFTYSTTIVNGEVCND